MPARRAQTRTGAASWGTSWRRPCTREEAPARSGAAPSCVLPGLASAQAAPALGALALTAWQGTWGHGRPHDRPQHARFYLRNFRR